MPSNIRWLPRQIIAALLILAPAAAMADCGPADKSFICGLKNPEDLVRLGETPWVVVSHVRDDFGPLEAIRVDTHQVQRLYPSASVSVDWEKANYPDCPTPPDKISSHGLSVRNLEKGRFRLYVVNHGGRESVEIIDISADNKTIAGRWRGCVPVPKGLYGNGVAALPDGRIVLSGGKVAIWKQGSGWTVIEGISGGNGVEVSPDGRWIFVADWPKKTVFRFPAAGGAVAPVFSGDYHPDNLRLGKDGKIYVVAHDHLSNDDPRSCGKNTGICDLGFAITKIDPATFETVEVFRSSGWAGQFGGGTTALLIGHQLWVGTFLGDRIAIIDIP